MVNIDLAGVEAFGRYKKEQHVNRGYGGTIFACDNPDNPELWYFITNFQKTGKTLVVVNANDKVLEAVKQFIPRQISIEAFRAV
jgi:hypothetical protein